jgi:hypothetical protein
MLLIQYTSDQGERRVGILDGDAVAPLAGYASTLELARAAIDQGKGIAALAEAAAGANKASYEAIARAGRLLPPLDHPDPAHCHVTGTGLTHLGSADARDAMHRKIAGEVENLSDSMKMFRLGVEGGKPAGDAPGVQPEIAGLYLIGEDGQPWRLGFALGNEFSDHVTERQNYLYLAHSKLRHCGVGPALRVGELPEHVEGVSRILGKDGAVRWEKPFVSGERNMSHSIANLEYHHFKYGLFQRPGDVHVHFFGTATLSFADNVRAESGETFEIEAPAFGPPLRNPLARVASDFVKVKPL